MINTIYIMKKSDYTRCSYEGGKFNVLEEGVREKSAGFGGTKHTSQGDV